MKILIVNKFLHPNGGSETYIFEIGRCLESMGHRVQYFGMEHQGRIVGNEAGVYTPNMDFHDKGIRGSISRLTYPFKIIHSRDAARRITRVLEDFKPDVVHFNNINFQLTPSVIEAVADYDIKHRTETKTVYTAHDSQWVCPNHMLMKPDGSRCFECEGCRYFNCARNRCIHGSLIRSLLGAFEGLYYHHKKTYDLIDVIIAPSEFMKNILESDPILKGKCRVMHNFVPESHPEEYAASGISKPDRYVLYFGRYSEEKGMATLLKCVKKLPDIRFVFAGSGPFEAEINSLGNIENKGFMTGAELIRLISEASFSVIPSEWHENCPFTVMESIAYGTPVIASRTGGTPELVDDGRTGVLFEAGNEEELTWQIRRLWDDEALTDSLTGGCLETHFMSVNEYCKKLVDDIYLTA